MKAIAGRLKTLNWYDYFLIPLFLIHFRQGIYTTWFAFTSKEFYENGIAFLLVSSIFIFTLLRKKYNKTSVDPVLPFILLITILIFNTVNAIIFKFSIVPAILFLLGTYALLGFYLEKHLWRRSIFIFLVLILCLPLLERVQKILGFPIRLVTAQIVSFLLQITGIGNISNSAVIVTENHATSIDLPCSGVKSIYTGTLFMLAIYYLQKVRLSIKLLGVTIVFFLALLFFNTWRVFSLVYIYDVLDMQQFGDFVHVFLGLLGFFISCFLLWFLTHKYVPSYSNESKTQNEILQISEKRNLKKIALAVLGIIFITHLFFIKEQPITSANTLQVEKSYKLQNINLSELSFSEREKSYFVNSDVEFSKKYSGKTASGIPFSLLIVSSKSARTHHDPEICLQGLGYEINNVEIRQVDNFRLRQLTLNDNRDQVLYWYIGKNKNLLDYSERVWEEVRNPKQSWTLVIIGFTQKVDVTKKNISDLILDVNSSTKETLHK